MQDDLDGLDDLSQNEDFIMGSTPQVAQGSNSNYPADYESPDERD